MDIDLSEATTVFFRISGYISVCKLLQYIREKKKNKEWSEVKWWEVLYGSEGVHYVGNKFGDGRTVLCLVERCEVI